MKHFFLIILIVLLTLHQLSATEPFKTQKHTFDGQAKAVKPVLSDVHSLNVQKVGWASGGICNPTFTYYKDFQSAKYFKNKYLYLQKEL